MPRLAAIPPITDWETDDPAARYKEQQDNYESYTPTRPTRWSLRVVRPTVSSRKIFGRSNSEVAEKFSALAGEWREATAVESSLERIILNVAYQQIIGLGPQVIPHILNDMEETQDHWFWALMSIVGDDKAAGQTSIGAAAEAWLAWGREEGIIS